MRKTNVVKILEIIAILFVISLICSTKVSASEASITATNCKAGENFTVNVNIPEDVVAYQFDLTVTYSDGSSESKSVKKIGNDSNDVLSLHWAGNYSTTFNGKVAGNATVNINNIILSNIDYQKVNSQTFGSVAITISENTPSSSDNNSNSNNANSSTPPPVVVNFSDVNETMYVTNRVNVRQNCGTEYGIIQTLAVGTQVTRTGIGDKAKNGYSWSRISYNGITGYVISSALTNVAPEVPSEEAPPEEETPEEPETPEGNSDITNDEIAKMAEELGVIPEVGLNIHPFMFLGACVSCLSMMTEIKRKMAK